MEERIKKLEAQVSVLVNTVHHLVRQVDPEGFKVATQMTNGDMSGVIDMIKKSLGGTRGNDNPDAESEKRW